MGCFKLVILLNSLLLTNRKFILCYFAKDERDTSLEHYAGTTLENLDQYLHFLHSVIQSCCSMCICPICIVHM